MPYDVTKEPLRDHTTDFKALLNRSKDLAKEIHITLKSCSVSSRVEQDIPHLSEDALDLSTFLPADTRTIAILGKAGEGAQSELITTLQRYCQDSALPISPKMSVLSLFV